MRIQVAAEEQRLEEKEARVPDGRTAAKERQYHLREERLNRKQQRGVQENCGRENGYQQCRLGPAY